MGERLNLSIEFEGKTLANAYYHWSGFSTCALGLAMVIIDSLANIKNDDKKLLAIKLLESTGAGFTDDELKIVADQYPDLQFKNATSRNDGLIAISENGIKETEYWAEETVIIKIVENVFSFKACQKFDTERFKEHEIDPETLKKISLPCSDINNIPLGDIQEILDTVTIAEKTNDGFFMVGNQFYSSIY